MNEIDQLQKALRNLLGTTTFWNTPHDDCVFCGESSSETRDHRADCAWRLAVERAEALLAAEPAAA
jgi:hypothetical protein